MAVDSATVRVTNVPRTIKAKDLFIFFESLTGQGSVYACEIVSDRKEWKSKGIAQLQFETLAAKSSVMRLSDEKSLVFKGSVLSLVNGIAELIPRPVDPRNRVEKGFLHCGVLATEDTICVTESWKVVKGWVMPERKSLEFWIQHQGGEIYKLEMQFDYIWESSACRFQSEKPNALLLKLKYAPKIYETVSGPDINSKLSSNRYRMCKEDFDFQWVRTTDFSIMKSIGQSSSLCWEINDEALVFDIISSLPYRMKDISDLSRDEEYDFVATSELVPLVRCQADSELAYEILFQVNSLVHTTKISLAAVDDVIEALSSLDTDTAMVVLQKMHKLPSTCYDPVQFIKTRRHVLRNKSRNLPSSSLKRLTDSKIMRCHRVLLTPSKIYCLGPELESSNYVVKKFASHASDFLRVTFVDEDWGKLFPDAVSTSIQKGFFAKPHKTRIYHRILSVLREGITIGDKRFEFLAFSASQLRSNGVWMFASNEEVKAEDIRQWMGSFSKIRNVSKCSARMGQLFSSSMQTVEVPASDVEEIPDIEISTDGVDYCFSDGIGKISPEFARQVAQKCGVDHTPSAFQIRYGGYKGVLAVDRGCSRKIALRSSMHKFESKSRMLNVTKCCEAMSCYLNREIVSLLSTLGVEDEAFLALQSQQLYLLDQMLTSREAALEALESMGETRNKSILARMLLNGYEPNVQPYLSMMLRAHRDNQLSDLRTRSRISVPKGRILIGCLDESGILNYGQVYARITMTKAELQCGNKSFFHKVDETTSIVTGKVVVTKNPCLHPGDVRVLEAVYELTLEQQGLVDCIVFPQKGPRPHPNECSGGDLDGDLYFISWDESLMPTKTVTPMDYTGQRPRIVDHDVTVEEIHMFFVDYMINDTLGTISTAHLIHSDREPEKALSSKCLELANLHSMAVDFAKTGTAAEMPRFLKPNEFPDFMERWEKPNYISDGPLGKLYRATMASPLHEKTSFFVWSEDAAIDVYDKDLEVAGFEELIETAKGHKEMYLDKMSSLMIFYGAESEVEILTGNLRTKSSYLQRDNRRYGETKDRILVSIKSLFREAKGWFGGSCGEGEKEKMASAWYHVAYHPTYYKESANCLGFPWIIGDILLSIKSVKKNSQLVVRNC